MASKIGLWLCVWMGWHKKPFTRVWYDNVLDGGLPYRSVSDHYRCERCKFEGLVDSHGSLF